MKLSPVQRTALAWYSIPAAQRAFQRAVPAPGGATIEALIRRGLLERVPHPTARGYTLVQLTQDLAYYEALVRNAKEE